MILLNKTNAQVNIQLPNDNINIVLNPGDVLSGVEEDVILKIYPFIREFNLEVRNNNVFDDLHVDDLYVSGDSIHLSSKTEDEKLKAKFDIYVPDRNNNGNLPEAFTKSLVFSTIKIKNPNLMEIVFWDAERKKPAFVINQGAEPSQWPLAAGRASVFSRSVLIGAQHDTKPLDDNYSRNTDWPNLPCDTTQFGADLGVEHAIEVPNIFTNNIEKSTGDGIFLGAIDGDVQLIDGDLTLDDGGLHLTDGDLEIADGEVVIGKLAGEGDRAVMVNNEGRLYA